MPRALRSGADESAVPQTAELGRGASFSYFTAVVIAHGFMRRARDEGASTQRTVVSCVSFGGILGFSGSFHSETVIHTRPRRESDQCAL